MARGQQRVVRSAPLNLHAIEGVTDRVIVGSGVKAVLQFFER